MNKVEDGGSGLISTAEDYLKFGQMLNDRGSFGGKTILSEEAFAMLSESYMENFGLLGVVSLGMGQAICMAKITNTAFSQFYQSEGSLSWGGAASTIFWADPVEDIVLVHMTQVLGHPVDLRADLDRLTYSSKN
jgi:CubicO group peptidase (beta-lactamase class C family)